MYTVQTRLYSPYHHTETTSDPASGFPLPQLVGQMVEYKLEPIGGDPKKGVNLLRNGVRVNKIPLNAVFFRRADPIYAKGNVGASPDAVIDAYVVPKGGLWGTMTPDVLARLQTSGHALMRTFHLIGYESQFTAMLSLADAKKRYLEKADPLEEAVWSYAKQEGLLAGVAAKTADTPLEYRLPRGRVTLQHKVLYNPSTAGDKDFANAKTEPGDQEQGKIGINKINLSAGSQSSKLSL
jgi:hypothetical protein